MQEGLGNSQSWWRFWGAKEICSSGTFTPPSLEVAGDSHRTESPLVFRRGNAFHRSFQIEVPSDAFCNPPSSPASISPSLEMWQWLWRRRGAPGSLAFIKPRVFLPARHLEVTAAGPAPPPRRPFPWGWMPFSASTSQGSLQGAKGAPGWSGGGSRAPSLSPSAHLAPALLDFGVSELLGDPSCSRSTPHPPIDCWALQNTNETQNEFIAKSGEDSGDTIPNPRRGSDVALRMSQVGSGGAAQGESSPGPPLDPQDFGEGRDALQPAVQALGARLACRGRVVSTQIRGSEWPPGTARPGARRLAQAAGGSCSTEPARPRWRRGRCADPVPAGCHESARTSGARSPGCSWGVDGRTRRGGLRASEPPSPKPRMTPRTWGQPPSIFPVNNISNYNVICS